MEGTTGAYHHSELTYSGREEGVLDLHLFPIGDGQLAVLFRDRTAALRVEAAQRLGIGRNTITRKLQELGMDEDAFE